MKLKIIICLTVMLAILGGCRIPYDPYPVKSYPHYQPISAFYSHDQNKLAISYFNHRKKRYQLSLYNFQDQSMVTFSPPKGQKFQFVSPKFSPDDQKLAIGLEYDKFTQRLALLDLNDHSIEYLTDAKEGVERYNQSFSHDGKRLVYMRASKRKKKNSQTTTQYKILRTNSAVYELVLNSKKEKKHLSKPQRDFPSYKPYYRLNRNKYKIRSYGNSISVLDGIMTNHVNYHNYDPSFNRMMIAFSYHDKKQKEFIYKYNLYIAHSPKHIKSYSHNNLDSHIWEVTQVTNIDTFIEDLSLSPDGKKAIIISNPSRDHVNTEILIVDIDSKAHHQFDLDERLKTAIIIDTNLMEK